MGAVGPEGRIVEVPPLRSRWLTEAERTLRLILPSPMLLSSEREKLQAAREIVLHLKTLEEERNARNT